MKICNICGTANDDAAVQCIGCQSILPVQPQKSKGGGKVLAAIAAVVAVVGAVVASVFLLGSSPAKAVGGALDKNEDAIMDRVSHLSNLVGYLENSEALSEEGDFNLVANIQTSTIELSGYVDYSRSDRVLAGEVRYGYAEQGYDLQFDFAADKKEFTLASDRYTSDIYGFKLKDFAKKFDRLHLGKLIPFFKDGKTPNIDFFKKRTTASTMEERYGEVWKNFKKTVKYKELNERLMQIGSRQINCVAYEINWDAAAATKLLSTILGTNKGLLSGLNVVFKQLEPDCRFYTDEEGYLVALDCVIAGNKCILTFEGEENLWDKCVLRSESIAGGEGDIRGILEISDKGIQGSLEWDGVMELQLEYAEQTGDFRMEADVLDLPWEIEGRITSRNGGAQLTVGGYIPEYGNISISLEKNPLVNQPELMSKKYVDLFENDLRDWERLLIDINNAG